MQPSIKAALGPSRQDSIGPGENILEKKQIVKAIKISKVPDSMD
jgi:hypothetical protein